MAAPSLSLRGEGIVSAGVGDSYSIGSAARFYLCCFRVRVFLVDVDTWLNPWEEGLLANASRGIPGFAGRPEVKVEDVVNLIVRSVGFGIRTVGAFAKREWIRFLE